MVIHREWAGRGHKKQMDKIGGCCSCRGEELLVWSRGKRGGNGTERIWDIFYKSS